MNEEQITFKLNDTEKIVINLEESLNEIHCCSKALIVFHKDNKTFKLGSDTLDVNLRTFSYLLTESLKNKLPLHKSVKGHIGYQYAQDIFFAYDKNILEPLGLVFDENNDWIGRKYLLWGHEVAAWIYNDKNGDIKLEFTSVYGGDYFDPEDSIGVEVYKKFLENYKSYLITTIPRETAQRWLAQANYVLKQIDENVERLIYKQKNNNIT